MVREPIPDDVMRFILVSISSVPYLEAMLLLRSEQTKPWDALRVAQRLYMSDWAARKLLDELHAAGILQISGGTPNLFRYQPESEDLQRTIDRLADCYCKNLIHVTNLIHSKISRQNSRQGDVPKSEID